MRFLNPLRSIAIILISLTFTGNVFADDKPVTKPIKIGPFEGTWTAKVTQETIPTPQANLNEKYKISAEMGRVMSVSPDEKTALLARKVNNLEVGMALLDMPTGKITYELAYFPVVYPSVAWTDTHVAIYANWPLFFDEKGKKYDGGYRILHLKLADKSISFSKEGTYLRKSNFSTLKGITIQAFEDENTISMIRVESSKPEFSIAGVLMYTMGNAYVIVTPGGGFHLVSLEPGTLRKLYDVELSIKDEHFYEMAEFEGMFPYLVITRQGVKYAKRSLRTGMEEGSYVVTNKLLWEVNPYRTIDFVHLTPTHLLIRHLEKDTGDYVELDFDRANLHITERTRIPGAAMNLKQPMCAFAYHGSEILKISEGQEAKTQFVRWFDIQKSKLVAEVDVRTLLSNELRELSPTWASSLSADGKYFILETQSKDSALTYRAGLIYRMSDRTLVKRIDYPHSNITSNRAGWMVYDIAALKDGVRTYQNTQRFLYNPSTNSTINLSSDFDKATFGEIHYLRFGMMPKELQGIRAIEDGSALTIETSTGTAVLSLK